MVTITTIDVDLWILINANINDHDKVNNITNLEDRRLLFPRLPLSFLVSHRRLRTPLILPKSHIPV